MITQEQIDKVLEWAKQRNLLEKTELRRKKQLEKTVEEMNELHEAYKQNDHAEIVDAIGDIAVTLIIHFHLVEREHDKLCYILSVTVEYMVNESFEEIYTQLTDAVQGYISKNLTTTILYWFAFRRLHQIAALYNTTVKDCLDVAYEAIKDRKGKMIDGTFVKEEE